MKSKYIKSRVYIIEDPLYRGIPVAFWSMSSTCLAQVVKNLNAKEFAVKFLEESEGVVENHYVDFDSVDAIEKAVKL